MCVHMYMQVCLCVCVRVWTCGSQECTSHAFFNCSLSCYIGQCLSLAWSLLVPLGSEPLGASDVSASPVLDFPPHSWLLSELWWLFMLTQQALYQLSRPVYYCLLTFHSYTTIHHEQSPARDWGRFSQWQENIKQGGAMLIWCPVQTGLPTDFLGRGTCLLPPPPPASPDPVFFHVLGLALPQ